MFWLTQVVYFQKDSICKSFKLVSMIRETLINKTIKSLSKLPNDKVREVSDFTEYILKKYEEETLQNGIEKLVSDSNAFQFLNDDEDLYTVNDIIEK